jgi:sarcosine oxidase subunit gamma
MAYEVTIEQLAPYGLLNVRADIKARPHLDAALGINLPQAPNTLVGHCDLLGLWLGPDEWLLRLPDGAEDRWLRSLRQATLSHHAAITIVSDAYTFIEVAGRDAREILSQGAEFDTHPRVLGPGQCARIRFAKTQVVIYQAAPEPRYHLYAFRSYDKYLMTWLERASGS